ncbi:MAG: sigma-70 family RNA polymerase sigma factor [Clostridia bacterium]|nr:sigma-70 family RNA polymerase sigma factor [Clostridia bacterium]
MTKFEKIFVENKNFIYKFLLKFCKDSSIAEELTQETFFRAYMNIANLKNEDKVSVWLCQIAKNTYFAWYNENKKILPLDESQISDNSPDIADLFAEKELSKKTLVCLHQLEEPYKEVFMLSVLGELSLKDISNLFGKSESWARVTFYRAKQKLIERMRELYGM